MAKQLKLFLVKEKSLDVYVSAKDSEDAIKVAGFTDSEVKDVEELGTSKFDAPGVFAVYENYGS